MAAIINIETGELITVAQDPLHVQGVWECGDQRFTDPSMNLFEAVATVSDPCAVTDFWELFTVEEEIAIRQKGTTDVLVSTWLGRLDDQRTTSISITLPSVIGAITYVAGDIPLADGRLEQILAGIPAL
jgi:hypothetical protein